MIMFDGLNMDPPTKLYPWYHSSSPNGMRMPAALNEPVKVSNQSNRSANMQYALE